MARRKKLMKQARTAEVAGVRIIGGRFRGRKLRYSGDLRTRPMKDRVREALFNLLGPAVSGKIALDLFAGTGALALEAISRGAARAVAIERHRPTAKLIAENATELGIEVRGDAFKPPHRQHAAGRDGTAGLGGKGAPTPPHTPPAGEAENATQRDGYLEVVMGDTFLWVKRLPEVGTTPWLVFCSPPYEFYVERKDDMLELLNQVVQAAPVGSLFAVEADGRFDFGLLPYHEAWDIRPYPPAVLAIWVKI